MTSPHKIDGGSLLDGINVPNKAATVAKPSLWAKMRSGPDISMNPKDWNQKQRKIAAVVGCCMCIGMLAGAAWLAMWMQPPALPTSAEEALKVMASSKFKNLDEQRKEEYTEAAMALFNELPWEQRRELFRDDASREQMREAFERQMEQGLRKWARGDQDSPFGNMPWGGPGGPGGGRQGGRPDGERPQRDPNSPDQPGGGPNGGPNGGPGGGGPNGGGGAGGGGGGRGPGGDPNARRDGAERRMADRVGKGNPQANGLGAQARQAMQKSRQGGGGR